MHYSDLKIYQLAVSLRDELHEELNKIPFSWKYGDIDQIKRSSSSTVSNIVEGYSRRFYTKDFIKFLIISLGSSDETQNHIGSLNKQNLLTEEKTAYYKNRYKTLSIKIVNYINYQRKKLTPTNQVTH